MGLREIRLKRGYTQRGLSVAAGLTPRCVERYEHGQRDINGASGEVIYRLSRVLKCDMVELLELGKIKG